MRQLPDDPADHRLERQVVEAVRRQAADGRWPAGAEHLGFGAATSAALLAQVGVDPSPAAPAAAGVAPAPLLAPLVGLLWAHRDDESPWTRLMAGAVGCACFGDRHLWQDLGLAGRVEVSLLLGRRFSRLAAGNTRNLRWKRYLFLRLGEQLGVRDLAPPKCDGCGDFEVCFGPPVPASSATIAIASSR